MGHSVVKLVAGCVLIHLVDQRSLVLGSIFQVYGATVIDYVKASKTTYIEGTAVDCITVVGKGYIDLEKGVVVNPEQLSLQRRKGNSHG